MGIFTLSFLVGLFSIGYVYRETIPLFYFFFDFNPSSVFYYVLKENLLLYLSLYVSCYVLLYHIFKNYFKQWKLNADIPSSYHLLKEFLRSLRGVLIGTMLECYTIDNISPIYSLSILYVTKDNIISNGLKSFCGVLIGAIILYLWGDFYFYWHHRLLHTKYLYQEVHKQHHESNNTSPFSGLSMHE
jgi:sterol desaturase/sphingolipid hydroxylase (fatty acid hydroxylase superfamily)